LTSTPMASPSKSTPTKSHPAIPEDIPLICPEPLAVDQSSQREMPMIDTEMSNKGEEEVQIIGKRKGEKSKRRSGRLAGSMMKSSEKRKRRKHDVNATEDNELLSEMIKKAKRDGKVVDRPMQKKEKVVEKGDSSNRGVDPFTIKKQKVKKKKSVKKVKNPVAQASSDSESEGEILPKLPVETIKERRVIRGKIIDKKWLVDNGLSNLLDLLKRQKLENVFIKQDLVYKSACREFYKNLVVKSSNKKEVASSKVNEVKIEFNGMTLASILDVSGNNGICNYMKGFWEESNYCNPLETTQRFSHDDTITKAGAIKSTVMRPFTRRDQEEDEQVESKDDESDSEKIVEDANTRESTPAGSEGEHGESEKEAEAVGSECIEAFFDAEDGGEAPDEDVTVATAQPDVKKKGKSKARGVDPSSTIQDSDLIHRQAEMDRVLKVNARFQELLQQLKPQNPPTPSSL
ncbi:hypothetical protein Dimus_026767, partial [Dionaea muscipula]